MKIKKIIMQDRRMFQAVFVCEGCENETEDVGYDENYFHKFVIPEMVCLLCDKNREEIEGRK